MCDPIAPVFLTEGMTGNRYFPEFLLPGLGLLDYDLLGRLYDPQQMAHAFGPSHLPVLTNLDDADQSRVWRATGRQGHPCGDNGCGIPWAYLNFLGTALQMAGPNLNPLTFERGLLQDLPDLYGGAGRPRTSPSAPTTTPRIADAKEVYWDPNARSKVDGKAGAYVPLNGGQRYRLGGVGRRPRRHPGPVTRHRSPRARRIVPGQRSSGPLGRARARAWRPPPVRLGAEGGRRSTSALVEILPSCRLSSCSASTSGSSSSGEAGSRSRPRSSPTAWCSARSTRSSRWA